MSKIEQIKQIYNNHINRIISANSQKHDQAVTDMAVEIDKLYIDAYKSNYMRYFLVMYIGTTEKGAELTGQVNFSCDKLLYLNKNETVRQIKETVKEHNIHSVVITNIIELSEIDYNTWRNE